MKIMRAVFLVVGLILCCVGCSKNGNDQSTASNELNQPVSADLNDPCTLVSQKEMEQFMGSLLESPYRVKNRRPNPKGDGCFYRGKDYRNVTLELHRKHGNLYFRMFAGNGAKLESVLSNSVDKSIDTLNVDWDKVGSTFGHLVAMKGPVSISIDTLGARLDLKSQARIMSIAISHLDAPLRYDGGSAAQKYKDIVRSTGNPCFQVTKGEAEALMGKLRADPYPLKSGESCIFPLDIEVMNTPVDISLDVQWSDGFYSIGQERLATNQAYDVVDKHSPDTLESLGIKKLGENAVGEKEPWDERITLIGGVIMVVKHDVLLKTAANGMGGFNEENALKLLRAVAKRI